MNIVVPIKMVPDLVEELEIDPTGTALDSTFLRLMINEFDEHAIEQAVLLKEMHGGHVTVMALETEDVEDALYAAAAKGVDELIAIQADFDGNANNHGLVRAFAPLIAEMKPDLILTGVQAHDNLDGPKGVILAESLGMPYVGYVAGVSLGEGSCVVRKEYPGGLIAELEVQLPAVLGIQAAEQPPRYVAISKIRQAMKVATIERRTAGAIDLQGGPIVDRLYLPEPQERATMFEGDESDIAKQMVALFKERGLS